MGSCIAACALALLSGAGPSDSRYIDLSEDWTRSQASVLSGFRNMYHPTVLPVDDPDYPYRMWFMGWAAADCNPGYPGCDAIFLARGKDLDSWEVYSQKDTWDATMSPAKWMPVLTPDVKPYDAWHNGDPSVVFHEGRYYMAYSATGPNSDGKPFGAEGDTDGDLYCVMGATSEDGIHWARTAAPLLIFPAEVGATTKGPNDSMMNGMYHRPSLLFDEGRWRLWFDYWTRWGVSMGYAEAEKDGFLNGKFRLKRSADNPALREWPNPTVVKAGDHYYAFSDPSGYGEGWAGRQMAQAISEDGLRWQIMGYFPPDKDTPACQVPSATIIQDDEATWMVVFYACQVGGSPEYDYRYDRIRYMKRKILE
ncbi:MAG: hypothetical protein RBU21_04235 [FCB group bacterium]|jgi:hypothetical protein|nr:hypothetical protein [FCB group bacterium]